MRKKTVTCDVGIVQCKDETVKCEKKVREPLNVRKELSRVGTTQYEDGIVKCEKKKGNHPM